MFKSHAGIRGRWFRAQYAALDQRLGPFDLVAKEYAAGLAVLWCDFRADTLAKEAAEEARRTGQGRRPSSQAVARLKKRAALSWHSYDAGLARLEALVASRPRPASFAAAVRAASDAGNEHR